MKNKLLALVLALTMVISLVAMVPQTVVARGVEEMGIEPIEEASAVLMTLKILQGYEDGSLQLDSSITRAELAAMISRTVQGTEDYNLNAGAILNINMSETPENIEAVNANKANEGIDAVPGQSVTSVGAKAYYTDSEFKVFASAPFSDVEKSHWAYDDIEYLRGQGIVSGNSDGTFAPESNVLYEEAVKFVVSALGYDFMAVSYGGYPEGYIKTATQLKILKNVSGQIGWDATRQQVMMLLFNAITADYLIIDGISDGHSIYETGKSILNHIYGMDIVKGQVMATKNSGITYASDATDAGVLELGYADMSGVLLKYNDPSFENYLGYDVKAYIKYDEETTSKGEVFIMFPVDKTEKITINASDITDIDISDRKIKALVGEDKIATIKYAQNPTVIYNDMGYSAPLNEEFFQINSGDVTFVSSDGTDVYDLILANNYYSMYVETVKQSSKSIRGILYNGENLVDGYELSLDDEAYKNDPSKQKITVDIVKADGTFGTFEDITPETAVSIKMWANHYKVYLGEKLVSGTISKKGRDYIYIGENKYESASGVNAFEGYALGDGIDVAVARDGKVFYSRASKSLSEGLAYGLLLNIGLDEAKFGGNTVRVKMADTEKGVFYTEFAEGMKFVDGTDLSKEYKLNGEKSDSITDEEIIEKLLASAEYAGLKASPNMSSLCFSGREFEQIIKFSLDSEGKINELVTARRASTVNPSEKENFFTVEEVNLESDTRAFHNGTLTGTPYNILNAVAYRVSPATNAADVRDSHYGPFSIGTGFRRSTFGVVLFDVAENGMAGAILTKHSTTDSVTNEDHWRSLSVVEYMTPTIIEISGEKFEGYETGLITNGVYERKFSLADYYENSRKFIGPSTVVNEYGTYNVGDIILPRYWGTSGYLHGVFSTGLSNVEPFNVSGSATYDGIYKITDMRERIAIGTPDQYFYYCFGSHSNYNYEVELTFGKVRAASGGRVLVNYGTGEYQATSIPVQGQKATKYDCKTGYVTVVDASEVTEDDWVFYHENGNSFKAMVIYTNVEYADNGVIHWDENKRD